MRSCAVRAWDWAVRVCSCMYERAQVRQRGDGFEELELGLGGDCRWPKGHSGGVDGGVRGGWLCGSGCGEDCILKLFVDIFY